MEDIERRRPRLLAPAIALVVLVVLAAGVYVLRPSTRDSRQGAEPEPSSSVPASPVPASPVSPAPGGCAGVSPPSQTMPSRAPADLKWKVENTALIPVSDLFGPAKRSGPVWTCFAHSPLGAVMAASVISARRVASFERIAVGQQQLVDNPGKRVFLKAVRATAGQDLTATPGTFAQLAGFRIDSYAPDIAVISSATRSMDGTLRAASLTVRWQHGDWRLQLLPDGGDTAALTAITTLQGYIPWGV